LFVSVFVNGGPSREQVSSPIAPHQRRLRQKNSVKADVSRTHASNTESCKATLTIS
jgi:hypothetical protein